MTVHNKERRRMIVTVSMGLIFVGVFAWMTHLPPPPEQQTIATSQNDQRLAKLEQAVTVLTQTLQVKQTKDAQPEPTRVTAPVNNGVSRQDLAQIIREEVRNAVAQESPE